MSVIKPEIDLGNHQLKNRVLLTLSVVILCSCFATGIHNITSNEISAKWVAASQFLLGGFFAFTSISLQRGKERPWFNWSIVYAYIGLIAFAVLSFGVEKSVSMWFFSVPVVSYFIFSRLHGFIISLLVLALFIYLRIDYNLYDASEVWQSTLINIVPPYGIIMALANAYENVRLQNEWELSEFALTDPLTSCYNRLALKSIYSSLQSAKQPTAILLVDIDHFKRVNDCYGHEAGDEVLKALSNLFTKELGEKSVFRIGGEEFLLVLTDEKENFKSLAEGIRSKVQNMDFYYGEEQIQLTFSGGCESITSDTALTDALKKADEALYSAKSQGRNKIVYI
ncbi:GGDEF domain-containing protein [Alteromonas gracilis]|uniref:GGDEF domain-containing protein n=1 Tax=Alteromonas gracilis TaxID=1479524 RepID=UPI003735CF9C